MLFNSVEFLLVFLPVLFVAFLVTSRMGAIRARVALLLLGSLFFYGWWEWPYLLLILMSIGVNFLLGEGVLRRSSSRMPLAVGVVFNLGLLGFFKYADFALGNLNRMGGSFEPLGIVLPLAISFFTFQQVAYLVDRFKNGGPRYRLLDYALFVSFFPQLIAGPIVRHDEMLPQFADPRRFSATLENAYRGVVLFVIGLSKKVLLADSLSPTVSAVFTKAEAGEPLLFVEAWTGALAYTFQLYFDFSGYVDMALGAGLLFGITLPQNFESPYKATNIIDFWRRWHMTLSRFLRDHLYIPLGGNRLGVARRYANLMTTMLLGGLWHGAGWNFVLWGGLHGAYLCINNAWRHVASRLPSPPGGLEAPIRIGAWALTFSSVVLAWVFFRASTFSGAVHVCEAMLRFDPSAVGSLSFAPEWPTAGLLILNFEFLSPHALLVLCFSIALFAPRSEEVLKRPWIQHPAAALTGSALLLVCLWRIVLSGAVTEFLYFEF